MLSLYFYLGYQKQPWFGPAGSENAFLKFVFSLNANNNKIKKNRQQ